MAYCTCGPWCENPSVPTTGSTKSKGMLQTNRGGSQGQKTIAQGYCFAIGEIMKLNCPSPWKSPIQIWAIGFWPVLAVACKQQFLECLKMVETLALSAFFQGWANRFFTKPPLFPNFRPPKKLQKRLKMPIYGSFLTIN